MIYNVELNLISKSPHTSSTITGFLMLAEQKLINLKINEIYNQVDNYPQPHMVEAIINGKKIAFDLLDGYNFDYSKIEKYISSVDFYFKRSFSAEKNLKFNSGTAKKIYPLGFNYHVTCKNNPIDKEAFPLNIAKKIVTTLRGVPGKEYFCTEKFEAEPNYKTENIKILFFTRLWELDTGVSELDKEREYINKMRIEIIRTLQKQYPQSFMGGVNNSALSQKLCSDLIIPNKYYARQKYLDLMKSSDICIGSMGLHESIGWKTAEYIAAARAIINEKLHYEVTGDFLEGKNYLSFDNAEECVLCVNKLVKDTSMLFEMKKQNKEYYDKYLRPDKQILYAISQCINN